MSKPCAVLLVLSEEFEKTLEEGSCGYRPPTAFRGNTCGHSAHRRWLEHAEWSYRDCYMCGYPQWAIVLAWEGEPLVAGWNHAFFVLDSESSSCLKGALQKPLRELGLLAGTLFADLGRIVLVDDGGEELEF